MRLTTLRRLAQRLAPLLNDAACTPLLSGGCARSPAAGQRSVPLLDCHAQAGTQSAHLAGCALSCEHDLRDDRHTQFAQRPVVLVQLGRPWSVGQSAGALAAPLDGFACRVARSREDRQPHAAQVQAHVDQLGGPWLARRSARALAAVTPAAHGGADVHTLAQAGHGTVRGFSATSHTDCRGLAGGAPVHGQAPASRGAQHSTGSTGTLQSGTVHADTGPAGPGEGNALPAAQVWGPPLSTSITCECIGSVHVVWLFAALDALQQVPVLQEIHHIFSRFAVTCGVCITSNLASRVPQLSCLHTGLVTANTHLGTQAEGLAAERLAARNAWVNLPNAISAARALSGPGVPRDPGSLQDACVLYVRACATVTRQLLCLL